MTIIRAAGTAVRAAPLLVTVHPGNQRLNLFELAMERSDPCEGFVIVRGMQSQQKLVDLVEEIECAGK